jgi:hypothetical protein
MKGLRHLYVVLSDPNPGWHSWEAQWLQLEEQLLEPVKGVTQTRWFELVLPYERCGVQWDMGDSRVVLRRPERERGNVEEV